MDIEKIKVRTENGQTLEVVVLDKRAERIQVVLGQGEHSVKCTLSPSRNALAYVLLNVRKHWRQRYGTLLPVHHGVHDGRGAGVC